MLASKFEPPPEEVGTIARIECENYVRSSGQASITILSAPAGYGKTQVMASWYSILQNEKQNTCVWISLDRLDEELDNPIQLLIESLPPDFDQSGVDREATDLAVCSEVLNCISRSGLQMVFFLDNFEVIQHLDSSALWLFFASNLPRNAKIVLSTRRLPDWPITHLQNTRGCQLFSARELCFSNAETAEYASALLDQRVNENEALALNRGVGGWPIAHRIILSSLLGNTRDRTLNQGVVARESMRIWQYALDNVLCDMDAAVQTFMQETHFLEWINEELASAVTEQENSEELIRQLCDGRILIPHLDARNQFEYLPVLKTYFESVSESSPALHRNAARYFHTHNMPKEALWNALRVQDYKFATQIAEESGGQLMGVGEFRVLWDYFQSVPDAFLQANPELLFLNTWISLSTQNFEAATDLINRYDQAVERKQGVTSISPIVAELLRSRIRQAVNPDWNDIEYWISIRERVADSEYLARSQIEISLSLAHYRCGRLADAFACLLEARRYAELEDVPLTIISTTARMARIRFYQGRLDEALHLAEYAISRAGRMKYGSLPVIAAAYLLKAEIELERNLLHDTERSIIRATSHLQQFDSKVYVVGARILRAEIARITEGPKAALELLEDADLEIIESGDHDLLTAVRSAQALAWLDLGETALVEAVLTNLGVAITNQPKPSNVLKFENLESMLVLCRFLCDTGAYAKAAKWLNYVLRFTQKHDLKVMTVKFTTILALSQYRAGETLPAVRTLRDAVNIAETQGLVRAITGAGPHIRDLLSEYRAQHVATDATDARPYVDLLLGLPASKIATFGKVQQIEQSVNPVIAQLTRREFEILHLVGRGLTNRGIADELVVSVGTIKWHLKNIFSKLGVTTRTEAVSVARQS